MSVVLRPLICVLFVLSFVSGGTLDRSGDFWIRAAQAHESSPKKVKNVILMIGDGMGVQQVSLAVLYRQLSKSRMDPLALERLLESKASGLVRTSSYGDIVTDSAAAATVMACGLKTRNEVVGLDPKGYPCETVLEKAEKMGKATGLVSTTRITHATPAAFVAHQPFRDMENEIAVDIVEGHEVDVLLSGGIRHFIPQYKSDTVAMKASDLTECAGLDPKLDGKSKRSDSKNLVQSAQSKGYQFVCSRDQLKEIKPNAETKILGLFANSVMPMIQEREKISTLPSLSDMTVSALEILSKKDNGFFLMVEGGLIDYAGHDNDAGTLLQETLDFDKALQVVLEFAEKHQDTLVLVTADHETGGFGFAYGKKTGFEMILPSGLKYTKPYDFADFSIFSYLDTQKMSFRAMLEPIEKKLYGENKEKNSGYGMSQAMAELIEVVESQSKYRLTPAMAEQVLTRKSGKKDAEPHDFASFYVHESVHPDLLGRAVADQNHVVWAAGTHTSTPVPIMAVGPSHYTDRVRGFIDNTEIAKIIEQALKNL